MAFIGSFNTADAPKDEFAPLPAGVYNGVIVGSEMKSTADNLGEYLQLQIDVADGEHKGRKFFERLNLKNKNDTAVKIAYQTLAAICKAVGKDQIQDSNELHGKRFSMEVAVEMGKDYIDKKTGLQKQGRLQNVIKKYSPFGAAVASAPPAGQAASNDTPPWK